MTLHNSYPTQQLLIRTPPINSFNTHQINYITTISHSIPISSSNIKQMSHQSERNTMTKRRWPNYARDLDLFLATAPEPALDESGETSARSAALFLLLDTIVKVRKLHHAQRDVEKQWLTRNGFKVWRHRYKTNCGLICYYCRVFCVFIQTLYQWLLTHTYTHIITP